MSSLPPSSPRLPSPPPPAEIQIGPKSPLMGPNAARQAAQIEQTTIDTNAKRRIHPGTKSADMAAGPPLVPLHELDSAFQLQEHLAALHYYHTASHTTPVTRETAKLLATPPPGIDRTLWLYELCRFLIAQCNTLIVGFLFDTPPCSASTCPEMRAGEWQFLCAVHDTPKSCCAIDYCCHTLDWAANVVTNPKIFPSRFVVDTPDKNTALKNLVNVFRRLHRIFAHAWFQHRGVFWSVETQGGLYVFFKTVCDVYDLLPAENYKLPPEAEGLDSSSDAGDARDRTADRRQPHQQHPTGPISIAKPPRQRDNDEGDYPSVSRTNTRRHIKSSPSTGSAVTTVPEADEDESTDLSNRFGEMRISAPAGPINGEMELSSIPVIVDHRSVTAAEQPLRPSSVVPPSRAATTESHLRAPAQPAKQGTEVAAHESEFASEPEVRPQPEPEPGHTAASGSDSQPETAERPSTDPAAAQQEASEDQSTAEAAGPTPETNRTKSEHQEPSEDVSGENQPAIPATTAASAAEGEDVLPPAQAEGTPSEGASEGPAAAGEFDSEPQATAGQDSKGQGRGTVEGGKEDGGEAAETKAEQAEQEEKGHGQPQEEKEAE